MLITRIPLTEWRNQIPYFLSLGYGILAPDLLGYGGTSKPLDINAYVGKSMAAEITAILDHEGVDGDVVGIAHDVCPNKLILSPFLPPLLPLPRYPFLVYLELFLLAYKV